MTRAPRTFADLVDAHQVEILTYVRRLALDGTDAEDLFQETFLRALRGFSRLERSANHRAWLYRIATNVFLNQRRSRRRRAEVQMSPDRLAAYAGPPDHDTAFLVAHYRRELGRLPRRQRAAFVQRRLLGRSYAEIASTMGGSQAAARANVYQAARRLHRRVMAGRGKEST